MRSLRVSIASLAIVALCATLFAVPVLAGKKKREKHAEKWPHVDLSGYSVLYIEEFAMTDPKADKRKKVVMVKGAPERLAEYVGQALDDGLFDEVHVGKAENAPAGSVILRGEITQYKPGSKFGRAMMAGAGSAHLDFIARLVDGASGNELTEFDSKRTWAWGGALGMSKGVDDIEQNVAYELALYLKKCKTGSID